MLAKFAEKLDIMFFNHVVFLSENHRQILIETVIEELMNRSIAVCAKPRRAYLLDLLL